MCFIKVPKQNAPASAPDTPVKSADAFQVGGKQRTNQETRSSMAANGFARRTAPTSITPADAASEALAARVGFGRS